MKNINEYISNTPNKEADEKENRSSNETQAKYVSKHPLFSRSNYHTLKASALNNQSLYNKGSVSCWCCGDLGEVLIPDLDLERSDNQEIIVSEYALRYEKCPACDGIKQIRNESFIKYKVIEDFQRESIGKAKDYLENHQEGKSWFIICGQVGSGKTFLTNALVNELNNSHNYQTERIKFPDELIYLKGVMNTQEYTRRIKELQTVKLLFIDDLFETANAELPSAADVKIAKQILDYRYEKANLTILNSEFSLNEITSKIDGSLGSRIYQKTDSGRFYVMIEDNPRRNARIYKSIIDTNGKQ